jgi:hypothetical protein
MVYLSLYASPGSPMVYLSLYPPQRADLARHCPL